LRANGIIDGEIVALNDHGTPDFGALQAALSEGKTENLVFYALDLLFSDGEDLRRRPLSARKERLQGMLSDPRNPAVPSQLRDRNRREPSALSRGKIGLLSTATIGLGIGVGTVSAAAASPQERVDAAHKAMGPRTRSTPLS
jgi:hypothetical protein